MNSSGQPPSLRSPQLCNSSIAAKPTKHLTPAVEAIPSGETATFLGRPYARKQFNVVQRQQPAEMTYRGVRYAR